MESAAWRSLPVGPRALLVELYALHNGSNNGEIFMSDREAGRRLGASKSSAHRWFAVLEARGFLRARQRGAFSLKSRHATTWILTEFNFAGQPPTKDFMHWQPPENSKHGFTGGTDGATGGTVAGPRGAKNPFTVSLVGPSGQFPVNDGPAGGTQLVYQGGGTGSAALKAERDPDPRSTENSLSPWQRAIARDDRAEAEKLLRGSER
jgi:hypothetical protein